MKHTSLSFEELCEYVDANCDDCPCFPFCDQWFQYHAFDDYLTYVREESERFDSKPLWWQFLEGFKSFQENVIYWTGLTLESKPFFWLKLSPHYYKDLTASRIYEELWRDK